MVIAEDYAGHSDFEYHTTIKYDFKNSKWLRPSLFDWLEIEVKESDWQKLNYEKMYFENYPLLRDRCGFQWKILQFKLDS